VVSEVFLEFLVTFSMNAFSMKTLKNKKKRFKSFFTKRDKNKKRKENFYYIYAKFKYAKYAF